MKNLPDRLTSKAFSMPTFYASLYLMKNLDIHVDSH